MAITFDSFIMTLCMFKIMFLYYKKEYQNNKCIKVLRITTGLNQ